MSKGMQMKLRPLDTLLALKALHLVPGLGPNDRRVAAALLEHFNRKTGQCDPGLNRVAELLGISTRTVIRSNYRLERAGLFKKTRHGGYSNRNAYEPNWARYREIEAVWGARFNSRADSSASEVSPLQRQRCHIEDDSPVTQTCRTNLPRETYKDGLPNEGKGRGLESRSRTGRPMAGVRSRDAAETAAERRWTLALHEQFASLPVTYGEILEAIDEEMQAATTVAEMRSHGAGLAYILNRLRISTPRPSANRER
jgi:hypothetical protein